ncbi:MAG: hypothetical protein NC238_10440 [Dehalobacter sp.]|nr:hypothetical protein [Dehalobacter sp.]
MAAINDLIKDVPQVRGHVGDNTTKTCPDCGGSGTNYCGMCSRPLSQWAIYRIKGEMPRKIAYLKGKEYPLTFDDEISLTLVLMFAGHTFDKSDNTPKKHLIRKTIKEFNQSYYNSSFWTRFMMDFMVETGDIKIVKENEEKIEQPAVNQPVKRRGRPRKVAI